ncbi:hypothetical protein [Methylocapsa acidiphila]|uniref:hypothetical protein n=1 Tax=Methylocapsa acidiphila TaxID=133552 RepID=UPI0012EC4AE7|nr:hypothetical protein [Methylocapsa acidiphila]
MRGASLFDAGTNSITPIPALQDTLVDNIVVLGKDGYLAQLGVNLDDQHVIYLPRDKPVQEVGKTIELGVDLAPWQDPMEGGVVEVFPDQTSHSFVVRARDFAFHFEAGTIGHLALLASHDEKDVNRFVAPTVVPDDIGHLWLINYVDDAAGRGIINWDRSQGAPINSGQPLFQHQLDLPDVVPLRDGRHAFANDVRGGLYLIDMKASMPGPALQLGGSTLTTGSLPDGPISFAPNSDSGDLKFGPRPVEGLLDDQATFQVVITEEGSGHQRKWVTPSLTNGEERYPLAQAVAGQDSDPKARIEYGRAASIRVTLSDPLGTNVSWTWTGVVFTNPEPLLARPWFRAVLVFFAICFVALVTKRLAGSPQTFTRYVLYIGSIGAPWVGKDFLDPGVLVGLLGASLLAGSVLGLMSPTLFRELEPLDPFRPFAGLATSIPTVRRRLFAAYSARLLNRIERERQQANGESYTPVPIRIKESSNIDLEGDAASPAERICNAFSADRSDERTCIILEAPGGRGKSALVREVLRLMVERSNKDPRSPIPVICDGDGVTLYDRMRESLGQDGFSDSLLRASARSGAFLFVLDGLTESTVTAKTLREHFATFGMTVPLLLSTRPSKAHIGVIEQAAASWIVIEPERLSDETLRDFVKAYGRSFDNLTPEVRAACRDEDGTYLPILIRLALLARGTEMQSIRDVYAAAVNQILANKGVSTDAAVQFCLDTYWETGERRIRFATASQDSKELLSALMGADLVVAAEVNPADPGNPHTVRFFHDSIQSYLTAVGLVGCVNWQENLEMAAGDPKFDADNTQVTELFTMCLHTFQPQTLLRKHLLQSLRTLSDDFAGALSRDWVVEATALPGLSDELPAEVAGGLALTKAGEMCFVNLDIRFLGRLYARAVRYLWPKLKPSYTAEKNVTAAGLREGTSPPLSTAEEI